MLKMESTIGPWNPTLSHCILGHWINIPTNLLARAVQFFFINSICSTKKKSRVTTYRVQTYIYHSYGPYNSITLINCLRPHRDRQKNLGWHTAGLKMSVKTISRNTNDCTVHAVLSHWIHKKAHVLWVFVPCLPFFLWVNIIATALTHISQNMNFWLILYTRSYSIECLFIKLQHIL